MKPSPIPNFIVTMNTKTQQFFSKIRTTTTTKVIPSSTATTTSILPSTTPSTTATPSMSYLPKIYGKQPVTFFDSRERIIKEFSKAKQGISIPIWIYIYSERLPSIGYWILNDCIYRSMRYTILAIQERKFKSISANHRIRSKVKRIYTGNLFRFFPYP